MSLNIVNKKKELMNMPNPKYDEELKKHSILNRRRENQKI